MNKTLTDIDVLMLAEKFPTLKGASTTDQIGFARALLAAQQPEPRVEVTAWRPIATVVKSNAGPDLHINGQRIFCWLGTMYNDDADRIAKVINDAARAGEGQ